MRSLTFAMSFRDNGEADDANALMFYSMGRITGGGGMGGRDLRKGGGYVSAYAIPALLAKGVRHSLPVLTSICSAASQRELARIGRMCAKWRRVKCVAEATH